MKRKCFIFLILFLFIILSKEVLAAPPSANIEVRFSINNWTSGDSVMQTNKWLCPAVDSYLTYGEVDYTWGLSNLRGSNFTNSTFQVSITSANLTNTITADNIQVKIYYNLALNITFVSPTPTNNSIIGSTLRVNATTIGTPTNCWLQNNRNGTYVNESMDVVGTSCNIKLLGLNNGTFFYNVVGNASTGIKVSETRNISIRNLPSLINLNSIANNTLTSNKSIILNWTINNTQSDEIIVKGYISQNTTANITKQIFYFNEGVLNESYIYNFTAMPTLINKSQQLWALYKFDNDTNFGESFNRVYDYSGNNKNGTFNVNQTLRQGKFGKGMFTSDSDDSQVILNSSDFANVSVNGMSINAWVNFVTMTASSYPTFVSRYNTVSNDRFLLFQLNNVNKIEFDIWQNGNDTFCQGLGTTILINDTWTMVTATYNKTDIIIYLNGIKDGNATCLFNGINQTAWQDYEDILIGSYTTQLNGTLDELGFWNKSLSAQEISDLYNLKNDTYYWYLESNEYNASNSKVNSSLWQFTIGSVVVTTNYVINITNSISLINTQTRMGGLKKSIINFLTLSAIVSRLKTISISIVNSLTFSNIGDRLSSFFMSISNILNIFSSSIRTFNSFISSQNNLNLNLETQETGGFFRGGIFILTINKQLNAYFGRLRSAIQQFTLTLTPSRLFGGNRDINQQFILTTSINRISDFFRTSLVSLFFGDFQISQNGLIGWWKLDINSTNQIDSSPKMNNGSVNGKAIFTNSGKINNAYNFLNSTSFINIGNSSDYSFRNLSNFTISAWVFLKGNNWVPGDASSIVLGKHNDTDGRREYFLHILDSNRKIIWVTYPNSSSGTATQLASSSSILLDTWNLITITATINSTANKNDIIIYINGVSDITGQTNYTCRLNTCNGLTSLYIGAIESFGPAPSRIFNGTIDEVLVYNRSLSASEVSQIYLATSNAREFSLSTVSEFNRIALQNLIHKFTINKVYHSIRNNNLILILDSLVNKVYNSLRTNTLSLILSNSVNRVYSGFRGIAQNIIFNLSPTRIYAQSKSVLNQILIFLSINTQKGQTNSISQSLTITSLVNKIQSRFVSVFNNVILNFNINKVSNFFRQINQQIVLTFSTIRKVSSNILTSFQLILNNIVNRTSGFIRQNIISLFISNSINKLSSFSRQNTFSLIIDSSINKLSSFFRKVSNLMYFGDYDTPTNDLVSWWTYDSRDINGVTALDRIGSNNGILQGTVQDSGILGESRLFDGNTDAMNVTDNPSLDIYQGNFTITMWIYPRNITNNVLPRLTEKRSHFLAIMGNPSNARFSQLGAELLNETGTNTVEYWSGQNVTLNTWQHVAFVYDGVAGTWYINSVATPTSQINVSGPWLGTERTTSGFNFFIAKRRTDNLRNLNGSIDEVRIYNRSLSSTEIQQIYNSKSNNREFGISRIYGANRGVNQEIILNLLIKRIYNSLIKISNFFDITNVVNKITDFKISTQQIFNINLIASKIAGFVRNIINSLVYLINLITSFVTGVRPSVTGGVGGTGINPKIINLTLCNYTYEYINTYSQTDYSLIDLQIDKIKEETNLTFNWVEFREYQDNWQPYCSDNINRSLKEDLVCSKAKEFKEFRDNSEKILNATKLLKEEIVISTNLFTYYIDNYDNLCGGFKPFSILTLEKVKQNYFILILALIFVVLLILTLQNKKKVLLFLAYKKKKENLNKKDS